MARLDPAVFSPSQTPRAAALLFSASSSQLSEGQSKPQHFCAGLRAPQEDALDADPVLCPPAVSSSSSPSTELIKVLLSAVGVL